MRCNHSGAKTVDYTIIGKGKTVKNRIKKVFLEGFNRCLLSGLLLITVTAFINFYLPKGPKTLYVILYLVGAGLLIAYMIGTMTKRKDKSKQ